MQFMCGTVNRHDATAADAPLLISHTANETNPIDLECLNRIDANILQPNDIGSDFIVVAKLSGKPGHQL